EESAVVGRQLDVERVDRLVQVRELAGADDRRRDAGTRQDPRKRDLHAADAAALRELADAIGDREVALREVELRRRLVAVRPRRLAHPLLFPSAGEKPARHRAARNHGGALRAAEGHYLALFFAV